MLYVLIYLLMGAVVSLFVRYIMNAIDHLLLDEEEIQTDHKPYLYLIVVFIWPLFFLLLLMKTNNHDE